VGRCTMESPFDPKLILALIAAIALLIISGLITI
jgi:hypothetical protein